MRDKRKYVVCHNDKEFKEAMAKAAEKEVALAESVPPVQYVTSEGKTVILFQNDKQREDYVSKQRNK